MASGKKADPAIKKSDVIHILILLAIAAGVGIYLIATTVLISKDSTRYITQAQRFSTDTVSAIRGEPFAGDPSGYPFLIYAVHRLVVMLGGSTSVYGWMYCAQAVSLLCRLGALIALYFIGKLLIGGRQSFWAVLVLVVLPYPAEFGSDALREWPYVLFLAMGFLFLLLAAKQSKWWMFGPVGLAAGFGHMIRPECAQLIIYGTAWLMIGLLLPNRSMSRVKTVCALAIIMAGFIAPAAPYMNIRGKFLPTKLEQLLGPSQSQPDESRQYNRDSDTQMQMASVFSGNTAKAFGQLFNRITENLMYIFMPVLLIGLGYRFGKPTLTTTVEKFFIGAFIVVNVTMMILLHLNYGYISKRHCLPLVALTIFYIPIGLGVLAYILGFLINSFGRIFFKGRPQTNKNSQIFIVLLTVGVVFCMHHLLRPIRIEKQGYRDVAKWLSENTSPEDLIAVTDFRITFYAQRQAVAKSQQDKADYAVYVVKNAEYEDKKPPKNWHQVHSIVLKKNSKLVVYKKVI